MAFLTLSLTETGHSFDVRSLKHSVFSMKKQNGALWAAAAFSLVLTVAVVYIPPLAGVFEFAPLGWVESLIAAGLSLSILLFTEITKLIARIAERKKEK